MRDRAVSKTCSGSVLRVNPDALSTAQFARFQSAQAKNGVASSDCGQPEQTKIALRQSAQGKSHVLEHNTHLLREGGFAQAGRTSERRSSSRALKMIVPPLIAAPVSEVGSGAATARGVSSRSGSPQHVHGAHSPINLLREGVAGLAAPPSAKPFSHDAFARCQPRVWIGLQGRPRLAAPLPMTSRRNRPRLSRVVLPYAAKELDQ